MIDAQLSGLIQRFGEKTLVRSEITASARQFTLARRDLAAGTPVKPRLRRRPRPLARFGLKSHPF